MLDTPLCMHLFLSAPLHIYIVHAAVTVSFEMAQYNVAEANGVQTVCVELTAGTVERMVVVSLASSNAEAIGKSTTVCTTCISINISKILMQKLISAVHIDYGLIKIQHFTEWHRYTFFPY